MDKLRVDILGEPQIKTVQNYATYIQTIAQARVRTFRDDADLDAWQVWTDILTKAESILNIIDEATDPQLFDQEV